MEQPQAISEPPLELVNASPKKLLSQPLTSGKVSEHLANERTFLAGVRTGIAVIAFGLVIARYDLGVFDPYSKLLGIGMAVLGIAMLGIALYDFLRVRRAIDEEHYEPSLLSPIVLTSIVSVIGFVLVILVAITKG